MGFIWRKNLAVIPVQTNSEGIFAVQFQLHSLESLSVIGVYLPPTDSPLNIYHEHLTELEGLVSSLIHKGSVLIMGDFNAHLGSLGGPRGRWVTNPQGTLLYEFIYNGMVVAFLSMDLPSALRPMLTTSAMLATALKVFRYNFRPFPGAMPSASFQCL